jgi:hypothetical protein
MPCKLPLARAIAAILGVLLAAGAAHAAGKLAPRDLFDLEWAGDRQISPAATWSRDRRSNAIVMQVPDAVKPFAEMPAKPEGAEWSRATNTIRRRVYRTDEAEDLEEAYILKWFETHPRGQRARNGAIPCHAIADFC